VDNFDLLKALQNGPQTGVALAEQFGISRAAVWKRIEALRHAGLQINALENRGYELKQKTQLLNLQSIREALPKECQSQLTGLHLFFETHSTQALALAVSAPLSGMEVWLAEMQTAGQGRRGKSWFSPPMSGISCSLNRRFALSFAAMSGFSLACAVILAESLKRQTGQNIQVKWPNDLWLDGRKCAGLLIQIRGEAQGPCEVTLGFGVNVNLSVDQGACIDQPWTSLTESGHLDFNRNELLAGLLQDLIIGFELYESKGFSAFIHRYRALDGLQGQHIVIHDGKHGLNGIAGGIDVSGALLVETTEGQRSFHSGEVSVRIGHD
jgi:BirA family biotin operon repressor/biotin-[acetyl-CoA-carboxylase] ligase